MLSRLELEEKAAAMRAAPTTCESRALDSLWAIVRPERQVVFGFYILDFVVPGRLLVIEIDGDSHAAQRAHDVRRDAFCVDLGLRVLRIPNALAHRAALELDRFPEVDGWESIWRKAQRRARNKQRRIEERDLVPTAEKKAATSRRERQRHAVRVLAILQVQGNGGTAQAHAARALIQELGPLPQQARKQKKPYTPPPKKKLPEERAAARAAKKVRRTEKKTKQMQAWVVAVARATEW